MKIALQTQLQKPEKVEHQAYFSLMESTLVVGSTRKLVILGGEHAPRKKMHPVRKACLPTLCSPAESMLTGFWDVFQLKGQGMFPKNA